MSRFCLRPRVRADIPGASRPKIETHQRSLDAKNRLAGNRSGSDFRGTPSFFLGNSDGPRREKGRRRTEPRSERVAKGGRTSSRGWSVPKTRRAPRRLIPVGSATAPGTSWSSTRTHETSRWRLCGNFENVRSVEVGTRDDGSNRIACAPVDRNFQTNRTLLTAAALTDISGNRAQRRAGVESTTTHKTNSNAMTGSRLQGETERRARKGESYDYPNCGEEASPNRRRARNDEHVQIHSVAAGQNGPVSRAVETRRSEHQSRALAACGSRGVDSQLGTNLQRMTPALSEVPGGQVSRRDRTRWSSFQPADAEPDVPSSKQRPRDVGRGWMVGGRVGADFGKVRSRNRMSGSHANETQATSPSIDL